MNTDALTPQVEEWIGQLHHVASDLPQTGACAVASALDLWHWTALHVACACRGDNSPYGPAEWQSLADVLGGLLSARALVVGLHQRVGGAESPSPMEFDLCCAQSAGAASEAGRVCASLVFGTREHPTWDPSCHECIRAEEVDALEGVMPGISYGARLTGDVMEEDGSHPEKAGPCVPLRDLAEFLRKRKKLDGCLSGSWLARQRAARAVEASSKAETE